jgi:hypothetical protein
MDSIEAEYQELHRGRTWTASQHAIQQSAKCGNTNLLWCLLIDSWTTRKIGNPYMVLMAMTVILSHNFLKVQGYDVRQHHVPKQQKCHIA